MRIIRLHNENGNEKELLKCVRKLRRYYNMSCKRLDINYNRIARIYGGALFDLIERDSTASDTEYSLSDIGSKVDEMISDISSIRNDLDEMSSGFSSDQRELLNDHKVLADKLINIEEMLLELKDEK